MAAKKKTAARKTSDEPTAAQRVATAADVAPFDQPASKPNTTPIEREEYPGIDPGLSSDNQYSIYKDNNAEFLQDTGNQVLEVPGKPKD